MPTPADPIPRRIAAAIAAAALLWAAPAVSQTLQGELVESGTGDPVPGAFVVLLDAAGEQRDADLTDGEGRFLLSAPGPGEYALGLDRIGYLTTVTDPIPLAAGRTIRYRLETVVAPVALEDIDVTIESECRIRPEEGRAVARAWEEARKALVATAFTQRMGLVRYTVIARERVLDPWDLGVRAERSRRRSGVTHGSPYVALPPEVLARVGYAAFDEEEQTYYGPDAATLLSDSFLDTHCLRLREPPPDRAGQIGVGFEPVEDRRLPDIEGTLWLDEASAELDRVEYGYVNLPRVVEGRGARGTIDFERLPTGEWIVREWRIRMPVVRLPDERMYSHLTMDPNARVPTVVRIEEDSGEVVEIVPARGADGARTVWAEPIPWRDPFRRMEADRAAAMRAASTGGGRCPPGSVAPGRAALEGTVRDARTAVPLPGARVVVGSADDPSGASRGALADPAGRFLVCGVPAGVGLEVVGSFPGRMGEALVTVPEGVPSGRVDLALTGDVAVEAPRVGSTVAVRSGDVDGSVTGTVVDASTGAGLAGAQVVIEDLGRGVVTGPDGGFALAGVPRGEHRLRVEYLGYEAAVARLASGAGGTAVEVRLVPSAIAVAALEVSVPGAEAGERRGRGYAGWRLTAEDIPESVSISVADLLARRFAGVTVTRSGSTGCPVVEIRGGRIRLVTLDGQPFRDTCVLEHVRPQDIESIEVVPGLAGGVTAGRAGGAGVIVVETRHGGG